MFFQNVNLVRKLTSRKFWSMLTGFITCLLILFKTETETVVQVTALIGAISSIITYILAEAYVDGESVGVWKKIKIEENEKNKES